MALLSGVLKSALNRKIGKAFSAGPTGHSPAILLSLVSHDLLLPYIGLPESTHFHTGKHLSSYWKAQSGLPEDTQTDTGKHLSTCGFAHNAVEKLRRALFWLIPTGKHSNT